MRVTKIQHPVIRLFMRMLVDVFFGRDEPNNLTSIEVDILYGALGPQPFASNIAYYIANHLNKVGQLKLKDVKVGALITHIAKAHMEKDPSFIVDFNKMRRLKGKDVSDSRIPPMYNYNYLRQLGFIKDHDLSDTATKAFGG